MSGWVALHRGLLDSEMWLSEPFTRGQALVDLIMLANHKEGFFRKRGVRIDVKRGQVGHSKLALADRWRWSRGKVTRYLNELEKYENIVQQNSKLTTLITIVKYEHYQGRQDNKQDNRRTSNGTTDGHQTDINNNDNKGNNDNKTDIQPSLKEIVYPDNLNLNAWTEYIDYRREAKIRKLTVKGEEKQIEKIIGFGDYNIQQKCIDETIANGWQGIFPPKQTNGNGAIKSKATRFIDGLCDDGLN